MIPVPVHQPGRTGWRRRLCPTPLQPTAAQASLPHQSRSRPRRPTTAAGTCIEVNDRIVITRNLTRTNSLYRHSDGIEIESVSDEFSGIGTRSAIAILFECLNWILFVCHINAIVLIIRSILKINILGPMFFKASLQEKIKMFHINRKKASSLSRQCNIMIRSLTGLIKVIGDYYDFARLIFVFYSMLFAQKELIIDYYFVY